MLEKVRQILEMIRFSHTIFALPFALLAAVMAWLTQTNSGETISFNWIHLLGIVVCMVFARSAAMAFNRLIDRKMDAENPRTAGRHLPAGILSVSSVLWFTVLCSLGFVACTMIFLPNWLPVALSVPVLGILMMYSVTKRFTSYTHFWLGIALALSPIAAWIAIRGSEVIANPLDLIPPSLLGGAVLFWVAGFDMIYSCQDYDFDKDSSFFSIPKRFGIPGALRFAMICHALMILFLAAIPFSDRIGGPILDLGWIYWVGISALAGLLIYEHSLVKPNDLTKVNVAFFNVNAVVSVGLFILVTVDLLI